jgi:hypothetical protein
MEEFLWRRQSKRLESDALNVDRRTALSFQEQCRPRGRVQERADSRCIAISNAVLVSHISEKSYSVRESWMKWNSRLTHLKPFKFALIALLVTIGEI